MFISSIQGTVFSKLGKATDVLQQLPMMMSSDGLSVLGRGTPLIYINNKLMRNSSELQRISSDMIKDIKIDMNGITIPGFEKPITYATDKEYPDF